MAKYRKRPATVYEVLGHVLALSVVAVALIALGKLALWLLAL